MSQLQYLLSSKIVTFLVMFFAIPFVLYMGLMAGEGNIRIVIIPFAILIAFILMFMAPKYLWVFAIGTLFVPGTIPGLPIAFKPTEIIFLLLIAKFALEHVIFGKRGFYPGPAPDWLYLVVFLLVLLFHGVHDKFAMRIFGSDIWGGRSYISTLLAIIIYIVALTVRHDLNSYKHLPTIVLVIGTYDLGIKLITTLFPSTAYYLYIFYSDVSTAGLSDDVNVFGSRWGFLGNYGYLLLLWSISQARLTDFILKGKWFHGMVFLLGLCLCVLSGYRSSVAIATIIVGCAALRDLGWKAIFGFIPLSLMLCALIFIQSGWGLPKVIQRGLTFLPASWDEDVIKDASGSIDFRTGVWDYWMKEEFPKHPVLGRGFGLPDYVMLSVLPYLTTSAGPAEFARDEAFVISGNLHNGFFSLIDRFGLVGMTFYLLWTITYIIRTLKYFRHTHRGALDPPMQWLGIYICAFTLAFFPGALRVEAFLPQQLFLVACFFALQRLKKEQLQRDAELSAAAATGENANRIEAAD